MQTDIIESIGIDEGGSLWVKPTTATFPHIYREAMEVHWDPERRCLYSPKPREASYIFWFKQIKSAAHQQGIDLKLGEGTSWWGIAPDLQQAIAATD